jgi:hypothetical protein
MATKLTTGFEKFAKQQRETNPDISEAEIEQLWSQQPLNKRIASGIQSAVITPARAIASVPEAVSAGYEKLDQVSRSGPNLKVDTRNMSPLWGPERTAYKQEQERIKSISPSTGQTEVKPPTPSVPTESELQTLSTPEVKKTIKTQLAQADQVAKNPPAGATPEQVDRFKEERDRAYKMYSEAMDRNEWLQLAQVLGQAVTQFGAAQVGMRTGRSMAGLQIPGIDYEARTGQEQRLLESRLRDVEGQQEREEKQAQRAREEERWKKEFGLKERELAGRVSSEQKEERKTTEKNLRDQLKLAQEQETAALSVANILASEPDLSDKTMRKIEEKLPGLSAKAGISTLDLKQIEQDATNKGFIWDTLDKEKKNKLIQERVVAKAKATTSNLLEQLKALESRSGTSKSAGQQSSPPVTIRVRRKSDGSTGNMLEKDFDPNKYERI